VTTADSTTAGSTAAGTTADTAQTPFRRWIARAEEVAAAGRFEVGIPMRDGVELAADVYLPAGAGDAAAPAIVQVTPYGKDSESLVSDEALLYQSHGYVFVAVDVRGRGKSEGEWEAFVNDAADTHDVIEWVAGEPWCDGKVGTTGLSYMGWVQWAGASQRPPHLRAMVSTSAAGRWQQEIPYTNGVFQLYFAWWAYCVRRRILDFYGLAHADWDQILRTLPFAAIGDIIGAAGDTWQTLCRRDTLDEYWKALRYDDRYAQIDVPCLHVTGWYDLEDLLGAFHHYEHMRADSPAAQSQYLLVGPWSHVKSRNPDAECGGEQFGAAAAHDMDAEHLRWFDHWLKGHDNGLEQVDRVRVFEPGRNAWRGAARWPLSDTVTPLYLGPGRLSGGPAGDEAADEFRYDPADPVPTGLDVQRYPFEDVPLDQSANEAREDVLCYTGARWPASSPSPAGPASSCTPAPTARTPTGTSSSPTWDRTAAPCGSPRDACARPAASHWRSPNHWSLARSTGSTWNSGPPTTCSCPATGSGSPSPAATSPGSRAA
jgi:putative CocE/NonD family hydrolase